MKILHAVDRVGECGGVAVYSAVLDKALRNLGHQTLTVASSVQRNAPLPERVIVTRSMFGAADGSDWQLDDLLSVLPWKPDAILVNQPPAPAVAKDLAQVAPLAIFQHSYLCRPGHLFRDRDQVCSRRVGLGCLPRWYARQCGSAKSPAAALGLLGQAARDRLALGSATKVVANSRYLKNQLIRDGVPGDKIEVVYPGCSLLILGDQPAAKPSPRSPEPSVSFAGRIVYGKGLEVLVKAMADLDARLEVAGDGWHLDAVKKAAGPNVHFHGFLDLSAVASLHQSAWLSVMPSISPEPFGMSGMEALSCGTPVVAFDVGGVAEWLAGSPGMLVSPLKSVRMTELKQAISNLLSAPPASQIADVCRTRAAQVSGLGAFSSAVQAVLNSLTLSQVA